MIQPRPGAARQRVTRIVLRARLGAGTLAGRPAAAADIGGVFADRHKARAMAAKAWLSRSADRGFMPAPRLLRSRLIAEAGPHGGAPHCHSPGAGQPLCRAGSPPLAASRPRRARPP
jgi:hypothetical protein